MIAEFIGFVGNLECIGFDSCFENDDLLHYRNSEDDLYIAISEIRDSYYMRLKNYEPCIIFCVDLSKEVVINKLVSFYQYLPAVAYMRQYKIDLILK